MEDAAAGELGDHWLQLRLARYHQSIIITATNSCGIFNRFHYEPTYETREYQLSNSTAHLPLLDGVTPFMRSCLAHVAARYYYNPSRNNNNTDNNNNNNNNNSFLVDDHSDAA